MLSVLSCVVMLGVSGAQAQFTNNVMTLDADPRLVTNFTSLFNTSDPLSLLTGTNGIFSSLTNLTSSAVPIGVFAAGAVIFAAAISISAYFIINQISPLDSFIDNRSYTEDYSHYRTTREAEEPGYDMLTLLAAMSDLYGRLNEYEEECQKQVICKTIEDPEIFGRSAGQMRYALGYASDFLDYWGLPYVAEVADAITLDSTDLRSCEERFPNCEGLTLKDNFLRSLRKVNHDKKQRLEMEEMRLVAKNKKFNKWQKSKVKQILEH